MIYRIIPLSRWTISNNSSQINYIVQKKVFNLFWLRVGNKWLSIDEAKMFINMLEKEYKIKE